MSDHNLTIHRYMVVESASIDEVNGCVVVNLRLIEDKQRMIRAPKVKMTVELKKGVAVSYYAGRVIRVSLTPMEPSSTNSGENYARD